MERRAVSFVIKAKKDLPHKLWHPSNVGSGKVMQSWEKGTRTGSDVPMYFALGV